MSVVEPASQGTDFRIEVVPSELGLMTFRENV